MVVSRKYGYAFVSVPKCATHSIYALLTSRFSGIRVSGPFHRRYQARRYSDHFCFAAVRNPFSRAVSIWHSTTQCDADRYGVRARLGTSANDFTCFARWLAQSHTRPLFLSMSGWLADAPIDRIVYLERLESDFGELPFVGTETISIDRLNVSTYERKFDDAYLDGRAVDAVRRWAQSDFDRFGYSTDPIIDLSRLDA